MLVYEKTLDLKEILIMNLTKEMLKAKIDVLDERDLKEVDKLLQQLQYCQSKNQGQRMAAILQRMANRKALSDITDPSTWQREMRQDRLLPGRE